MWNRISGKSNDPTGDLRSQSTRRNDDEQRQPARRPGSIASFNSNQKSSSRADDRDPRGFNPSSTSYSSTTRGQYPGAASASIASSYATASGNTNGEPYVAPDLVRNASLADQMPRSSLSRSSRDQDEAREVKGKKRDKTERSDNRDPDIERRQKRDKRDKKVEGLRKSRNGLDEEIETSRGPDDFPDQVASTGFSQFPGQYDGAISGPIGATPEHPVMSSHVQDQFPGQFPTQTSAPYRPPLAASEGGPGLAAEYYGDDGQSVAEQPGNRVNTPSLIIGAEPHLQPALAVAAPPPEPSASGAVGAAASFFSGEFEEDEAAPTHGQQNSSTYVTGQIRPNSNHHSSSAPVIPTIGGTALGSAAGYFIDSQTSSHQQRPDHESSVGGAPSEYSTITTHRPPSQTQDSQYSSTSRPPKPGKQSSQSSNIPMYAAGVAGAAGLAVAAYGHNHHSSDQDFSSIPQYSSTSVAQRHRDKGPLDALVDFFKDPEGVAQFEEYSQIIGVCRHCFAPGSSAKDAPRRHFYGRRRSNERYGSSARVDKDSRYYSSETEGRRKNKSWLATGLAGYGLAKVGESLFKEKDDVDDIYSVKTGRFSPDGRDRRTRRRSRSKESIEDEIIVDGRSGIKEPRDDISDGTKTSTYSTRRHSRTESRSKDQKTGLTEAAIGAALGTSVVSSSSRRQSRSPQGTSVKSKHKSQASSPERRPKTKEKKKRDKGFFSFGNGSSSSSSVDLAYTGSQGKHRSSRRSNGKSKDDKKAEAALLGLGAAAAALALNDGRQSHRKKNARELVGVKETKNHRGHGSAQAPTSENPSRHLDDELWESAAEDDYESINSDLAYGAPVRRDSRASFSSESSGTSKWGWRWGSKKNRRASSPRRKSSDHSNFPAVAGTAAAGLTGAAMTFPDQSQGSAMDSTSSLPLQHVYPVPTSDPSRFDVGKEGSIASSSRPVMSSRPEAVPLQHPQPIAPVSAAIYSSQTPYDHSYSAPTGPAVFSQNPYHHDPRTSDARHSTHEASIPGSFPRFEQQADDAARDFRIRRRDTSPARFGKDSISRTMGARRQNSAKDDSSAVRFDLTEEQEEKDRRERRRKRKQDKERREAEEQEQIEKDRRASKEQSSKKPGSKSKPAEGPERSSGESWIGPAAAGVIGAAIGAAAATDKSRSEETREERRERRRRERELEDEEDALSKSERRRRQRERDGQEAAIKERDRQPDDISALNEDADRHGHPPERQDISVWQEAASTKRSSSHENYGAFFTPLELLNKSGDHVKITSANADADIDLEQVPQIVTVEPKRIHDLSDSPEFSLADTNDTIDLPKLSFPWQVPRLRLVEPTPPSTRGSTPIPRPKDAGEDDFEEPRKEPSPSKVKWEDDQTREYTIIAPKEDRDEFIEPTPEEISGTDPVDLSRSTHERDLPDDETHSAKDLRMEGASTSYGDDAEFAATLAASAEDAGFDPSIVINNPTYRRRDSPPGSNEGSMPDRSDGEDEPRLNKKERKKKEKASRRQRQNESPDQRDDNAVVQEIISQVEESESRPSENYEGEWESTKKGEFRKPKKGQKDPEFTDDFFEASEFTSKPPESESRDVHESLTEDVRSIASNTPISNETESGKRSRKKSKGDSTGFYDAAPAVPSPSTTEASKDSKSKSKDKRKGSIWDRALGKSTGSLPQENAAKDVIEEEILEDFEEPKKKSKKSQKLKSTRNGDDDHDSKERYSIGGTTPQISGRISQDLPAKVYTPILCGHALSKQLLIDSQNQGTSLPSTYSEAGSVAQYLDHDEEPEKAEEKQPDSFSGMRPEPPPPPDTHAGSEESFDPLGTASLPISPGPESETQNRRFPDAEIFNPIQTTVALPSSPRAIPIHFRQPGWSSSTARSLSQTPLSSNMSATDRLPKRPRSTEPKSSKEIRPLVPVEKHRSHQEPTPDEIYPSLSSSHQTSRSSAVHNLEGSESHQKGDYELNEAEHEPADIEPGPMVSSDNHPIRSDLLDSQQATPTASAFHDSSTVRDLLSPRADGESPLKAFAEENPQHSSSTLKSAVLGAILGGSAALALNEPIQSNDPSRPELSREEKEELEHGLDEMALDTGTYQSDHDSLDQEEDFVPPKTKKGKKAQRKADQSQQQKFQPPLPRDVEATPSTDSIDPEPLNPESMRQLEEQDAQDAVNSWSPSVLSSKKGKKGKKGKRRALVERLPEESGPSPNISEPSRDNLETTAPAEVQESDTLTREMPREQVVYIMTAAAQDTPKDDNEASQSATAIAQEPSQIPQDNLPQSDLQQETLFKDDPPHDKVPPETQPKTRPQVSVPQESLLQDDLPQNDLPQDDFPQSDLQRETVSKDDPSHSELPPENQQKTRSQDDLRQGEFPQADFSQSQGNLPQDKTTESNLLHDSPPTLSSSAPAKATFIDPFLEQGHENVLQSPKALPASPKKLERGDLTTAISRPLELSPKAIPLPDGDDDHDLLDERLGAPIYSALDHFDDEEKENAAKPPLDVPHIENPSAVIPEPQEQLQYLPAQAEKVDAGDYFADLSKEKSKKGKKAKQSFSAENSKTTEIQEGQESPRETSAFGAPKGHETISLIDGSAIDAPQPKSEAPEGEWTGFNGNKKGKKGKKVKPSLSGKIDKATEIGEETELLSIMATSKAPELHEARDLVDEPAMHAPNSEVIKEEPKDLIDVPIKQAPEPEAIEDDWERSDSKKGSENVEKQTSTTLNLGPRSNETEHQFERQPDVRDDMKDRPSSLATTQTSREVSAMLRLGENEVPKVSQVEHNPHIHSEDQISGSDERNLFVASEPETPQFEDASGKALDDERSPTLETSVAGTNAAQAVQDMLAAESNAEPANDARKEAMVLSTGMEETTTGRPIEEHGLDWDARKKKKKGKKGRKNEASPWDEPEMIEPAEVSGTLGAMNVALEQEPAADRPLEEDGLDRDAPKKKKKGKKGKKSEALSLDEPEIIQPAELSDSPAAMKPPQLEQEPAVKAMDEVSSKHSKKEKRDKKGKRKGVSRIVSGFQDEDEPNDVPTETPQDDDMRNLPTIIHDSRDKVEPLVVPTGKIREEVRRSGALIEAPQDDDRVKDLPAGSMPPMRVEVAAPGEVLEPTVPTAIAQDSKDEQSQEASLGQDQDFMPPKSSRNKKKSRKSKKSNAFSLDDDETPTIGDGQSPGTKELEKDGAEQEISSKVDPVEEPEKAAQKSNLDPGEDFMMLTNKRDKKKPKNFSLSSQDKDISPALEDGPVFKPEEIEKEAPVQTLPSSVDVVKKSENSIGGFSQEKDQETEEAEPLERKNVATTAQSEHDATPDVDSNVNPPNASGDLAVDGQRGEPVHTYFDPASAHAATSGIPHKATSLVTLSLEQPANAWEAITTDQANNLEDNIAPAVETEINPLYSAEDSQKDKRRSKTASPLIWEEHEVSQEPRAVLKESSATENLDEKLIPVSQDSESRSKPDSSSQKIESTEMVQPAIRSREDQGFQESVLEEQPSRARDDVPTMVEAEQGESLTDVKKSNKGKGTKSEKLSIPDPEANRSAADENELASVTATTFVQGNEQTSEQHPGETLYPAGEIGSNREGSAEGLKMERASPSAEPIATDEAKDKELLLDVPAPRAEKPQKQHNEAHGNESDIVDLSSSAAPEPARRTFGTVRNIEPVTNVEPLGTFDQDEPISAVDVDTLDTQEQRNYDDEYTKEFKRAISSTEPVADVEPLGNPDKERPIPVVDAEMLDAKEPHEYDEKHVEAFERAVPNTETVTDFEPLGGPEINKPIPAVEVEMLDAQEQRDYNEEYAKELERQLSPLQQGERADPSRDEADAPVFSQSSIASVMERPYEEEHRPLARPPALEDIIEEPRSRPGSVQGTLADREDSFSPLKSTKSSKKGKKGKRRQPVIWEDETATPPLEPESDQGAKYSTRSSGGPGSWSADAAEPLDLKEPVQQRSLEDMTIASPIRDFGTAENGFVIDNDRSGDYFTIQPSRPAEEDVGRDDNHEFRQALSTEPPYSTRDQSPARESQITPASHPRDDVKAFHQDEELDPLAMMDFHDKPRIEAESAGETVEDEFDPTLVQNTKKGKKSEEKASAREPGPQALEQEDLTDRPQDLEAPATGTSNERSPSRQHSLQPSLHEDEQFSVAERRPTSRSRSGSMGRVAAVVGLGVSQLVAENFSRRDSKEEERHSKRAKEAGTWTDFEAETGEPESPLGRGELPVEEQEHRQTPESTNAVREWQLHQATPPQSPTSAKYEAIADHLVAADLGQSLETPQYRDSAVYVSGSPMIPEETPYHRAVRDSGYPDTEASPVINDKLETADDPMELESGVAAGERVGHVQHWDSPAHETDELQRSTSRNPLKISVEADSDYDVSVSRPKERRKRSRRSSGAAYDSDDSADSGFDIQRRRRRQAMAGEPREPSPVSSTTKDRSSALFDSSPSAREETVAKPQYQGVSPRYDPVSKGPTWSLDREGSPQQASREASREGKSAGGFEPAPEPTGYELPTGNGEDTGTSLFGGPQSFEDDLHSLSRSPRSSESRGRQRLNTISEDSADGSPLHKKDKRTLSDVGSPESGVKGRRMRSPPVEDDVTGEYLSTYDSMSRQAWPAGDEEKHAVDERSRSRNSDELSNLSSRHSALSGVTPRHREDEYGTGSAVSMKSEKSVHAIIRTPDQVRSASGLSYRSSGTPTPPLRRVDRSASGDLRGANQKSEAKSRAKSSSELDAQLDIGIPSSSSYDPVTDKGKSRADMADVYVSLQADSSSGNHSAQN